MTKELEQIFTTENVGPELAKVYLAASDGNRNTRLSSVKQHAIAMAKGQWLPCQPIIFDINGRLIDGHHRLLAIIESGVTVQLNVLRGVPPEVAGLLDTGIVRTVPDLLKRDDPDMTNLVLRVACVNMCAELITSRRLKIKTLPEFYGWYSLFKQPINFMIAKFSSNKLLRPASISGTLAFSLRTDPERIEDFCDQLAIGDNLEKDDPALVLRKSLISLHPGVRSGSYRSTTGRRVLNAARNFLFGEKVTRLHATDVGRQHFLEAYSNSHSARSLVRPWLPKEQTKT